VIVKISKLINYYLILRYLYPAKKIIVASNGRAGSSMLFLSIAKSFIKNKCRLSMGSYLGQRLYSLAAGYIVRLNEIESSPFVVCKTHDVLEQELSDDVLYIFVHGDPLDSALSVQQVVNEEGLEWFKLHQYNLKASGSYDSLFTEDVLNYRQQLESWFGVESKNVLCLAYEDIWDRIEELSEFIGFEIELPKRRERKIKLPPAKINTKLFDELRQLRFDLTTSSRIPD
jgi:hypothetical protein